MKEILIEIGFSCQDNAYFKNGFQYFISLDEDDNLFFYKEGEWGGVKFKNINSKQDLVQVLILIG